MQASKRPRRRRVLLISLACVLALAAAAYVNNSSWLAGNDGRAPLLLAHRGLAQTFDVASVGNDTCTAEVIYPPEHPYLENTIESMRAAFDAGADIVEFDIQVTRDNRIAVFHDHELGCRTNSTGRVRDHTLADLQILDVGYRYTADGGASFPFRGKGIGKMPAIEDVLTALPGREFLIDVKSGEPTEGEVLAGYLATLPADRLTKISVYGGDEPIAALTARLPQVRVMSKAIMKDCLLKYLAVGATGYVPDACAHRQLHIPEAYAPYLWGWPTKFVDRMAAKDTRVVLVAGDGGFSEGFDSADDWQRLPAGFSGVIWTNRIDRVATLRPAP
ncbi:glycerophosphodiester phosphodiesterase family protein [Hamadaea sp. NPDC051192]|uniref:glycerophosphodiester phosphodiesterase family protein n=1 Tax=Hamadaea sp. NPDC051192 TaxID=3154940 RepID=UPI003416B00C